MVLFVSDSHFSFGDGAAYRKQEDALIRCLTAHQPHLTHLLLVGDIFDSYIEYRRLVPKGLVRLMGLLAAWVDQGIQVSYLVGNHDPWHRDYFGSELGVRVHKAPLVTPLCDKQCYVRHGDGLGASGRFLRALRPLLRNRAMVALYRNLMPAEGGTALAHHVSRRLQHRHPNPRTAADMRTFAHETLQSTGADLVVMGHSHQHELCSWPEGVYLNLGSWCNQFSFGLLSRTEVRLLRWRHDQSEVIAKHAWPPRIV